MDQRVADLIASLLQRTSDAAFAEAPEVLRQLISSSVFNNTAGFVLCAIMLYLSCKGIVMARAGLKSSYDDDIPSMLGFLVSGLFGIVSLPVGFICAVDAVSAYLWPKAYLVDLLMKKMGS